jgi:signal peptidase II
MGFAFHVILVSLLLIMSFLIYGFIQMKKADFLIIKIAFVFLYSGLICALIDIIFWGGSLDYIWLKAYFTFDLKDSYINTFEILMAIAIIKYHRIILGFKSKEFFNYCSVKFKSFSFLLSK